MKKQTKIFNNIKLMGLMLLMLKFGNVKSQTMDTVDVKDTATVVRADTMSNEQKLEYIAQLKEKRHNENLVIAKFGADRYIKKNIEDMALCDFMRKCIITNGQNYYWEVNNKLETKEMSYIKTIQKDYIWFDDLMKYLSGKMTDIQFCDTKCFEMIKKNCAGFFSNAWLIMRIDDSLERLKTVNLGQKQR